MATRILRDKDEGMSTEVDQYVALWIEATGLKGPVLDLPFNSVGYRWLDDGRR